MTQNDVHPPPDVWPALEIAACAAVLPGRDVPGVAVSNAMLTELMLDAARKVAAAGIARSVPISTVEFPLERMGIRSRNVLDESWSTRGLAVAAARKALARAEVAAEDLRIVLVSTVTPDVVFPSLSSAVHHAVGAPSTAEALDLTLGCTGFVSALGVAARRLAGEPEGAAALVVASDAMLRIADASDRSTLPIFGDGAGAVLLRRASRRSLHPVCVTTMGEYGARIECAAVELEHGPLLRVAARGGDACVVDGRGARRRMEMDGPRVFRDMVRLLPERVRDYLGARGLRLEEVDRVLFHQANQRLVEAVAESLGLDAASARVPSNIATVGNTASASIPILLADLQEGGQDGVPPLNAGERLLLVAFGSGYSVAITLLEWS